MRIEMEKTQALMIDMQKRLMPVIAESESILERTRVLLQGLSLLQVPLTVTTQYRKGLGETIEELYALLSEQEQVDKISFSCMDEPEIKKRLEKEGRRQVLVFGVEAHICVLQTVIDLREQGYTPVVILDCIGSRKSEDKEAALLRMKQEGALFSSAESILYELTRRAGNDSFRQISRLTRERP